MTVPTITHQFCQVETHALVAGLAPTLYTLVDNLIPPEVDDSWWSPAVALAVLNASHDSWWMGTRLLPDFPATHSAIWSPIQQAD